MIVSVSRRTDIPATKANWFYQQLGKTIKFYNPRIRQVEDIVMKPDKIDAFVFWTKNPEPMMWNINLLSDFVYYFQYTITPYMEDLEPATPDYQKSIATFCKLSDEIGKERVIWRYDPIILSPKYNIDYHKQAFKDMCEQLDGKTDTCVFSFLDVYSRIKPAMKKFELRTPDADERESLVEFMASQAKKHNITLKTCAERESYAKFGVERGACIDKVLIETLRKDTINAGKDITQRQYCGCCESIDIGKYNTCPNGCVYCYANASKIK